VSQPVPNVLPALSPTVVDTDVVSYIFKRDTRAAGYEPHLVGRVPVISFMTVAELDAWADQRDWGQAARRRMERALTRYTVHFPDRQLCRIWAAVTTAGRRMGRPIGLADAWIAATALLLGAPLVTHNAKDYAGVPGLVLLTSLNP
jgi:predicted nucleic acid-binding protein